MYNFKFIFFIIFLLNIYISKCSISDKRFCIDKDCSEPISSAKTLLRYSSPDLGILSFSPNEKITVFSKEAGSRQDLWGVEINGKRGYVPKHLVRESKVFGKPTIIVDTELPQTPKVLTNKLQENVNPDKVKEPFEVVDGTTIFLDPNSINPSSTESPILSTASTTGSAENQSRETEASIEKTVITEQKSAESIDRSEENTDSSVVGNVLSSFKNWMNEDESEEGGYDEDEDADMDDDEDGEEDEEEEIIHESAIDIVEPESESLKKEDESIEKSSDVKKMEVNKEQQRISEKVEEERENEGERDVRKNILVKKDNLPDILKNEEMKEEIFKEPEENQPTIEIFQEKLETKNKASNEIKRPESISLADEQFVTTTQPSEDAAPKTSGVVSQNPTEMNAQILQPQVNTVPPMLDSIIERHPKDFPLENEPHSSSDSMTEEPKGEEHRDSETSREVKNKESTGAHLESPLIENSETIVPKETPQEVNDEEAIQAYEESLPIVNNFSDKQISQDSETPDENNREIKGEASAVSNNDNLVSSEEIKEETSENITRDNDAKSATPVNRNKSALDNNWYNNPSNSIESTTEVNIFENKNEQNNDVPTVLHINSSNENKGDEPVPVSMSKDNHEMSSAEQKGDKPAPFSLDRDSNEQKEDKPALVSMETVNDHIPEDISVDTPKNNDIFNEVEAVDSNLLSESQDELIEEIILKEEGGLFSGLYSLFGGSNSKEEPVAEHISTPISNEQHIFENINQEDTSIEEPMPETMSEGYCTDSKNNCDDYVEGSNANESVLLNSDILLYLGTTAIACIVFLFIYMLVDKSSREAPLVEKINKLEKELMITTKEKELLQEGGNGDANSSTIPNEELDLLRQRQQQANITIQTLEMQIMSLQKEVEDKQELEEQIESLEKELETSTEVGMELNRIISEMLDPTNGSEKLKENVEQLQRQLLEQKCIINDITKSLNNKEKENTKLQAELDISKQKTNELQSKLDEIVDQILKIEKERDQQQKSLQEEISLYQQKFSDEAMKKEMLNNEIEVLKAQLLDAQRKAELKIKEYQMLKDSLNGIKSIKNDKEALQSLLDATSIKAELEQLKVDNERFAVHLKQEEAAKIAFEKKCQAVIDENNCLTTKYQESEREKVEATLKLEVLNNYFKKREEELQSDILKYKSIWDAKEGEATSTTERIKLMAEEIENYKSQNVTLKQEIVSQEIDLKSQISILENKVHENWVTSRQMERKLEDARHEAAQLRNRLTLRERAIVDERTQNRLQSPLDQNGELVLSPPPIESPASPPMLFSARDHITKSPPLSGLPPFLPPPPGVPFMPPPPGMPFMPPPPAMFPGDHRPPPLGRMSSPPPLNSRYSPDTSAFSPYERNTPSPPYDSEYGASPTPMRGYSPYNSRDDRRDYKRPMHVSNGRNNKGSLVSSGSDHSNDSLGKMNRKHSKMV